MAVRPDAFKDYCLEQLEGLGRVTEKAMFGGFGIYCAGTFFAIVYRGKIYFRTGEDTRAAYKERGMGPFQPRPGQVLKSYYEVPSEVLDRAPELVAWARAALGAGSKRRQADRRR